MADKVGGSVYRSPGYEAVYGKRAQVPVAVTPPAVDANLKATVKHAIPPVKPVEFNTRMLIVCGCGFLVEGELDAVRLAKEAGLHALSTGHVVTFHGEIRPTAKARKVL